MQKAIFLLVVGCVCLVHVDAQNYGTLLGSFSQPSQHDVSGKVYMVDARRIRIREFNYDGRGPDAYFWYGTTARPGSNGKILPNEGGSSGVLGSYSNDDIVLTFPEGTNVCDAKWLSVWCRRFASDFAHVIISCTNMCVPASLDIGQFSTNSHGVMSGNVVIRDSRTVRIDSFSYDGTGSDTFFFAGTGAITASNGVKVPDENGSLQKLSAYTSKTIELKFPADLSVAEYRWISVYDTTANSNYGSVNIPADKCVPPYIEMPVITTLPNCEKMDENFNVAWEVMNDTIVFEFTGALDGDNGYMSFGVSGSDNASVMIGADAMVVYLDNGQPKVEDYTMDAKSLCSNGRGVCPDTTKNGNNSLEVMDIGLKDGVTTVKFKRPLSTGEPNTDKDIVTDREMYTVWATGNVNNLKQVTKHTKRLNGDQKIHFGQTKNTTCKLIKGAPDTAKVTPWTANTIPCNTNTFRATIGPTGGKKGYSGITGQVSWGIAWYLNGDLIPELTVVRGQNYTFYVEGGVDPSIQARYHPLYITNDPVGGYEEKNDQEKTSVVIYAGTEQKDGRLVGTDGRYCEYKSSAKPEDYNTFADYKKTLTEDCDQSGSAGNFTWTPDKDTPDLVYYQCFTHNYLGWKIRVRDSCPPDMSGVARTGARGFTISLLFIVAMMGSVYF